MADAEAQAIVLPGGELRLFPSIDWGLPSPEILARLTAEISWRQESITLFGKTHLQPRLLCWMGDPGSFYSYSGKRHDPVPWHPLVADLRQRVERLAGAPFNAALLNLYRDGQDSMGFHADDEPELGPQPIIASVSFGAERVTHFRHRHDRTLATRRVPLPDSSLLIMRGSTQANWNHAIPKTRKAIGPRINLTFRRITG